MNNWHHFGYGVDFPDVRYVPCSFERLFTHVRFQLFSKATHVRSFSTPRTNMCCQRNKSKIKWHREGRNKEQNICCFALVHTLWARPKMSFRAQSSSLCVEQFSVCLVLGVKRNHVEGTSFERCFCWLISQKICLLQKIWLQGFPAKACCFQKIINNRNKISHLCRSQRLGTIKARSEPLFFSPFQWQAQMRLDILQKKKYDEKSVGDSCVVNFTWNDLLFKEAWQSGLTKSF